MIGHSPGCQFYPLPRHPVRPGVQRAPEVCPNAPFDFGGIWVSANSRLLLGGRSLLFPWVPHAPVAQLDRASDYGSEGWEFDSLRVHHLARAQVSPGTGPRSGGGGQKHDGQDDRRQDERDESEEPNEREPFLGEDRHQPQAKIGRQKKHEAFQQLEGPESR